MKALEILAEIKKNEEQSTELAKQFEAKLEEVANAIMKYFGIEYPFVYRIDYGYDSPIVYARAVLFNPKVIRFYVDSNDYVTLEPTQRLRIDGENYEPPDEFPVSLVFSENLEKDIAEAHTRYLDYQAEKETSAQQEIELKEQALAKLTSKERQALGLEPGKS